MDHHASRPWTFSIRHFKEEGQQSGNLLFLAAAVHSVWHVVEAIFAFWSRPFRCALGHHWFESKSEFMFVHHRKCHGFLYLYIKPIGQSNLTDNTELIIPHVALDVCRQARIALVAESNPNRLPVWAYGCLLRSKSHCVQLGLLPGKFA